MKRGVRLLEIGAPLSTTARVLVALVLAIGSFGSLSPVVRAAPNPSVRLNAPKNVAVGEPIELRLVVAGASDIAGYEANLLFDTAAAEFSGLLQRDNDLRKFGRDVGPLGAVAMPNGVAIGLYSCPVDNCVAGKGPKKDKGGNGTVRLATASILANQPGVLDIKLDAVKFVDAAGNPVSVDVSTPVVSVQVGPANNARYPAPNSTWTLANTPAPSAPVLDLTGDNAVTHVDAMEAALEWTVAREQGTVCAAPNTSPRDINNDGCIDVSDVQIIAANYSGASLNGSLPTDPGTQAEPNAVTTASVYTVNSTADTTDAKVGDNVCATSAGLCTLRAAIAEANAHAGADTIAFNIPGSGVQTIQLGSRLPTISDTSGSLTIDGYTQPGSAPNTDPLVSNAVIRVQLVGAGETQYGGLFITSGGNVVRGLSFFKFTQAVRFFGSAANGNRVIGCFVGTNADGTYFAPAVNPGASGVHMQQGASRNYVGGTAVADRNVLSGNAHHGVATYDEGTASNVIINNLIGLSPAGDRRVPNANHGVDINFNSSSNIVGGTGPGERNVLSGNGSEGVELSHGSGVTANKIIGNFIGTDVTGTRATSFSYNVLYGVNIEDVAKANIVRDNVIGNNRGGGINIVQPYVAGNQVYNNRIGISLDGTPIPNGVFGVQIDNGPTTSQIGPNNIIAYNPTGIRLTSTAGRFNKITRNSIFGNTGLGIDIAPLGAVNPNDAGDVDTGANDLLNFPVISSATPVVVSGTACAGCTVEVFVADGGAGVYGEGRTFIGSGLTGTNGQFSVPVSGAVNGDYVTATAIDAQGNTSEFARNVLVSQGSTVITYAADTFSRTVTDQWGSATQGGAYSVAGTAANYDVSGSVGTMVVPGAGNARAAVLPAVSAQDVDLRVRVQTDKAAAGGPQYAYGIARRVSSNTEYRGQVRFSPDGSVRLRASRVSNGAETLLGTDVVVAGLNHRPNTFIWLRMQVVGTNPTTIQLKAWADGQPEPGAWQYTTTDATASLQAAGAVGLRAYVPASTTNVPVTFIFDDLQVTNIP